MKTKTLTRGTLTCVSPRPGGSRRSHGRARATRLVERAVSTMRAVVGVRVATAAAPTPVAREASAETVSRRDASLVVLASVSRRVGRARGLVVVAARRSQTRAESLEGRRSRHPTRARVRDGARAPLARRPGGSAPTLRIAAHLPARLPRPAAFAPTPPTMFPRSHRADRLLARRARSPQGVEEDHRFEQFFARAPPRPRIMRFASKYERPLFLCNPSPPAKRAGMRYLLLDRDPRWGDLLPKRRFRRFELSQPRQARFDYDAVFCDPGRERPRHSPSRHEESPISRRHAGPGRRACGWRTPAIARRRCWRRSTGTHSSGNPGVGGTEASGEDAAEDIPLRTEARGVAPRASSQPGDDS